MRIKELLIEGSDVSEIISFLKSEFPLSYNYITYDSKVAIFILERFSFIQNSELSITIIIDIISVSKCKLLIIVTGGRSGIFRLDIFGLEESMLRNIIDKIKRFCSERNLKLIISS